MTHRSPTALTTSRGAAWYAVILLTVAYFLAMVDRMILPLLIEPTQRDLGLSDTQFGLLQGPAFAVFYLAAGIPIGWLVDRTSRRYTLCAGIGLWSLATVMSGFSSRFGHLLAARIGVGVGEASLNPSAYSLLADLFPKDGLGRALAVFQSGGSIGLGFAYVFGAGLMAWFAGEQTLSFPIVGDLSVWQAAFIIAGLPGIALAALMLTMADPKRVRVVQAESEIPRPVFAGFLQSSWKILVLHMGGFAMIGVIIYAYMTWGPALLLRNHNLSPTPVGLAMGAAAGLFGPLGFFVGGALADFWLRANKQDAHMRVGVLGVALSIPLGCVVALNGNTTIVIIALCALMFTLMMPTPAGIAGLQLMTPPELRGRVSAIFMVVINLMGLGLGPVLVPLFTDYVFQDKGAVDLSLVVVTLAILPVALAAFTGCRKPMGMRIASGPVLS